jgi:hypothetical protein
LVVVAQQKQPTQMRHFARGTAFALMLLLGQFTLVGSGYACLGEARARAEGSSERAAPGMSVREAPDDHTGCNDAPRTANCMLSGFTCTALGACGIASMTGVAWSSAGIAGLTSELVADPAAIALTRSIAPESPPPRA